MLHGQDRVTDGGSFTLITGVLAREPIATGVISSTVNGGLEAFVNAAAPELPPAAEIRVAARTGRRHPNRRALPPHPAGGSRPVGPRRIRRRRCRGSQPARARRERHDALGLLPPATRWARWGPDTTSKFPALLPPSIPWRPNPYRRTWVPMAHQGARRPRHTAQGTFHLMRE